ncbi:anti-sigma factor [Gordonia sp. CPCC 205333]|uniref:anti-sigma factor n=1 Tax=Gordonia sp. CPCC 205333 TaxID=3140790 RepID=UPI003AF3C581
MRADHADFAGTAELYVVDGLPDDERTAFERHVRSCPICADDVAALSETVAALSLPGAELPGGVRQRVMAAVDAEGGDNVAGGVVDLAARRRRTQILLAAACAVVVALGAAVVMWRVNDTSASQPPIANPPMVQSVLSAPDMTKASDSLEQGTVAAMYAPSRRATVVATEGLPAIPSTMMYQVWITVGGKKKSAGMVPGGRPEKSMVVMTDMERPITVGLSIEPASGSSQPTSPMVVDFPVS